MRRGRGGGSERWSCDHQPPPDRSAPLGLASAFVGHGNPHCVPLRARTGVDARRMQQWREWAQGALGCCLLDCCLAKNHRGIPPGGRLMLGPPWGPQPRAWRQRGDGARKRGVARRCACHTKPLPEPRDASASCDRKGPTSSESTWRRGERETCAPKRRIAPPPTRREQGAPST